MAPSLIAVMVRRLLGVYVRRPTPPATALTDRKNGQREHATGHCTKPSTRRQRR